MTEGARTAAKTAVERLTGKKFAGSIIATLALCFLTAIVPWLTGVTVTVELIQSAITALVAINFFFFGGQAAVDGIQTYLRGKNGSV